MAPTAAVAVQLIFEQAFPRPISQSRQAVRSRLDTLLVRIADFERRARTQAGGLPAEAPQDIERVHARAAELVNKLQK